MSRLNNVVFDRMPNIEDAYILYSKGTKRVPYYMSKGNADVYNFFKARTRKTKLSKIKLSRVPYLDTYMLYNKYAPSIYYIRGDCEDIYNLLTKLFSKFYN